MKNKLSSPLCRAISISGRYDPDNLSGCGLGTPFERQPKGRQIYWGMPFDIDKVHVLGKAPLEFSLPEIKTRWLCFLHTAEDFPMPWDDLELSLKDRLAEAMTAGRTGKSPLKRRAATYFMIYDDGSEVEYPIRYRYEINTAFPSWGENCFAAVSQNTPEVYTEEDDIPWGLKQFGHYQTDRDHTGQTAARWICAWQNPHPEKTLVAIRLEAPQGPKHSRVMLAAMTACDLQDTPIRWQPREKRLLTLPGEDGVMIDMGVILSVLPHMAYDNQRWESTDLNSYGVIKSRQYLVEYAGHPQARLQVKGAIPPLQEIPPARQRVTLKVIDSRHRQPVAVRLHIHGHNGEYLPPTNRHRQINSNWAEDYGPEFAGPQLHNSSYMDGTATVNLPLGKVYIEISKGFECTPVRKIVTVTGETNEIVIEIEKILDWREKGWVTADTHVHYISPKTANLEGAAEGVNVVNLLASQWGEMMSNAGDFDGKSIFSNREAGDEYLVRVGTENRQHVLGHISLLGYNGPMISPMCAGGADESAIGDPVDVLLTEWAKQCQAQDGLVVLPHMPQPRAESAAAIVSGYVDAVEICAIQGFINPYTLVNWYRYLNCGYHLPLAAGTDKMMASMEIGRVRVYSKLPEGAKLTYDNWKESMRAGNSFATFGPLLEFAVNGKEAGSRISLKKNGGRVTVTWCVETVKFTLSSLEMIVNGELVDGKKIAGSKAEGYFELDVSHSAWICLLVRGNVDDGSEKIIAHTSAVMIDVANSPFFSAPDAVSILDQIEGSIAYIENIGTRADTKRYKEMRLLLEQSYQKLHARLHHMGHDHDHHITHDHH